MYFIKNVKCSIIGENIMLNYNENLFNYHTVITKIAIFSTYQRQLVFFSIFLYNIYKYCQKSTGSFYLLSSILTVNKLKSR